MNGFEMKGFKVELHKFCILLNTQFLIFGGSIYDFSFMDVFLPFSSTLGWHSLQVKGEVRGKAYGGYLGTQRRGRA